MDPPLISSMTPEPPAIVSEADLERELRVVRAAAAGGPAGIFGRDSIAWRVDREAAIFLAAGRALLLQLAHPWVAAAIAQHSRTLADPIGRFHRTFGVAFTMVFGTTIQAITVSRRLHRRHATITGILSESSGAFPAGSPYAANDVAALRWVHATLTDSALLAFELVNPPLSDADRERYYAESRLSAALFGIPQSALPQDWSGFARYVDGMFGSDMLAVGGAARGISTQLLASAETLWRAPRWYRALTASLLPPRLREEFQLPYELAEKRSAARALAAVRRVYPWIPPHLRYLPPYHEAVARLTGHNRPPPLTRVLNRFWIGRSSMAIGGE